MSKSKLQLGLIKLLNRCKTLSFDDAMYLISVEMKRLETTKHINDWSVGASVVRDEIDFVRVKFSLPSGKEEVLTVNT